MRLGALILVGGLLGVSACQKEPTFDERYDAAQEKTRKLANDIDKDLMPVDRPGKADSPDANSTDSAIE